VSENYEKGKKVRTIEGGDLLGRKEEHHRKGKTRGRAGVVQKKENLYKTRDLSDARRAEKKQPRRHKLAVGKKGGGFGGGPYWALAGGGRDRLQ